MSDKKEITNPNLEHDSRKHSLADVPVEQLCATKHIERDVVEDEIRRRHEQSKLD